MDSCDGDQNVGSLNSASVKIKSVQIISVVRGTQLYHILAKLKFYNLFADK